MSAKGGTFFSRQTWKTIKIKLVFSFMLCIYINAHGTAVSYFSHHIPLYPNISGQNAEIIVSSGKHFTFFPELNFFKGFKFQATPTFLIFQLFYKKYFIHLTPKSSYLFSLYLEPPSPLFKVDTFDNLSHFYCLNYFCHLYLVYSSLSNHLLPLTSTLII